VGDAPVGLAISPDGRWLYSTSALAGRLAGRFAPARRGSLSVINVATAERNPGASVIATVSAGCTPVRVTVSPNGADVWVTARESDDLLAFSAARLLAKPGRSELATVRVGEAPVGLALVDGGRRVVVADSNRFNATGRTARLTVVNAVAALAHRAAIVGTIRSGLFPFEMALEPAGTVLLVGNFESGTLEAVHVGAHAQETHGPRAKTRADD
jgi:DNA-binding beta-propeller fold protein YncE